MKPFLSLIRFPNLLIIAFTQYMMRYTLIWPSVESYGYELQLNGFTFFCIVLATMCTAAAGYAINDYFDVKADNINRPGRVIVGNSISRRKAMKIHSIFCVLGVLLGGYVTWEAGVPLLVLLFILVAGMLWLYSFTYKRQFLIGNLIVSLFTALVPMLVLLDIPPLHNEYRNELLAMGRDFYPAMFLIMGFAAFAFLTTLSREIIKDTEDFEGDAAYGCRSVPITLEITYTKQIIVGINLLIIIAIEYVFWRFFRYDSSGHFDYLSFFYTFGLLVIPLLWLSRKVYQANTSADYRNAGNWMKAVMLFGILYGCVLCWRITG